LASILIFFVTVVSQHDCYDALDGCGDDDDDDNDDDDDDGGVHDGTTTTMITIIFLGDIEEAGRISWSNLQMLGTAPPPLRFL